MIERFILPKRLANPAQLAFAFLAETPLSVAHNPLESHKRFQKHMHVIRHNDPNMQTVLTELGATNESVT